MVEIMNNKNGYRASIGKEIFNNIERIEKEDNEDNFDCQDGGNKLEDVI